MVVVGEGRARERVMNKQRWVRLLVWFTHIHPSATRWRRHPPWGWVVAYPPCRGGCVCACICVVECVCISSCMFVCVCVCQCVHVHVCVCMCVCNLSVGRL